MRAESVNRSTYGSRGVWKRQALGEEKGSLKKKNDHGLNLSESKFAGAGHPPQHGS